MGFRVLETELQLATAEGDFRPLFTGRGKAAKANRLTPLTLYRVRGRDRNDAGWSEYSPEISFSTSAAMKPAPRSLACVPGFATLTYTLAEAEAVELQIRSVGDTLDLQLTLNDEAPRSLCATSQFCTVGTLVLDRLVVADLRPTQAVEVRVRFLNGIFTTPRVQALLTQHEEKSAPETRKRRERAGTPPSVGSSGPDTPSAMETIKARRQRKQGSKSIQIDQYQLVAALLIFIIGIPAAVFLLT